MLQSVPAAIRQMPPERIFAALTKGVMRTQAANLNDEQKRRLTEFWEGGRLEAGDGRCESNTKSLCGVSRRGQRDSGSRHHRRDDGEVHALASADGREL